MHQNQLAALRFLSTVICDLVQAVKFALFLFLVLNGFHILSLKMSICQRKKQNACCMLSTSSSSPNLLVIIFSRLWEIKMNDEVDIRFVNSHTKTFCCYNYINFSSFHSCSFHLRSKSASFPCTQVELIPLSLRA